MRIDLDFQGGSSLEFIIRDPEGGGWQTGHCILTGIDQSIRFGHVVSVHVLDVKSLHVI